MAKDEDGGGSSGGGWISKFGLPTLILSLVTFLFQMQQNAFDRSQRMLETGYQFYSSGRSTLEKHSDVEKEATLLMVIGQAFPNIFCNVRKNMIERAISAKGNGSGFDSGDSDNLLALLRENAGPAAWPVPTNLVDTLIDMRPRGKNEKPPACAEEQPVPTKAAPLAPAPAIAAASVAPEASAGAVKAPAAAGAAAIASSADKAAPAPVVAEADIKAATQLQTAAAAPTVLRVFFQIPRGTQRDIADIDSAREELAPLNYRVVRGVERVPLITAAEVRYYGPDAKTIGPAAEQLAKYLSTKFGMPFRARWLGATYPNNPPNNVEVWLPDAPGSRAAVIAGAARAVRSLRDEIAPPATPAP